jgi:beta-lactamase class A
MRLEQPARQVVRAARALLVLAACLGLVDAAAVAERPPRPARSTSDPKRAEIRRKIEERLARLVSGLQGASGYVIRDLASGDAFEKDADAVFPAASTIKLPIFLDLLKRAEEGTLDLARPVPIDPKTRVEGGGVLEKWSVPYPVLSADHLAVLMMDFSDNYATNVLIDLVGMDNVQRRLNAWGMKDTLLRRRMMDLEAARAGRENVTTPRDMAALLERLYRGEILNAGDTRRAIEIMKRNEKTPIKRGLPPSVPAADKDGDLDGLRCDSGIVFVAGRAGDGAGGARPFVISVMTAYLQDDQAGEAFIGDVTRAARDYFGVLARSTEFGRTVD